MRLHLRSDQVRRRTAEPPHERLHVVARQHAPARHHAAHQRRTKLCLAALVVRSPALTAVLHARAPGASGAAALTLQVLTPDSGKLVTPQAPAAAQGLARALPIGPERAQSVAAQP